MLRSRSILRPMRSRSLAGLAGLALAGLIGAAPARAQSSSCQQLGPQMMERKSLVEAIQKLSGKNKKMDPKEACAAFGKLATNGTAMLKWAEVNKDWCQVPDHFVEGIKNDHEKVTKIRGQACGAAAKQAELEKRARSGQGGSSGLLGGDGLEGTYKIPKGAL
jgi:hypothetical protein